MATLLQALVAGVPTLLDAASIARQIVADTNGTTALVAGNLISLIGGTPDKADAATAKYAAGYVRSAVSASAAFSYYTDGLNDQVSGLTKGNQVFLGAAGAVTTTPPEPAGAGNGWQHVGVAISTTGFEFVAGLGHTRA